MGERGAGGTTVAAAFDAEAAFNGAGVLFVVSLIMPDGPVNKEAVNDGEGEG
jgi:hypothetical protein